MLSEGLRIWRATISKGAVWSTLIWSIVFVLLLVAILAAVGAGTLASSFYHPTLPGTAPVTPVQPGRDLAGVGVMYLVILAAGPFLLAGLYGLYGQAVAGVPVAWRSFWSFATRFYGRAWGLYFFGFLWMIALSIVAGLLVAALHVVGGVVAGVIFVLSLPWAIRMAGGLFVDRLSWGESFRQMFQSRHYGALLGGLFLAVLVYMILVGLSLLLARVSVIGIILYIVVALFLSVAVPVWGFSLYRAASS
ncbi:hypothetical protein [Sulfobacillus harzensis]|uniref:DUF4013 domain-containing protein n=1 Tax=Sulfobacillus harzensis TaxID=2729629 RepID=A0A7Y0Q588_9FIRM|nr:hypothetical protein [Sulfobacillus harzensis]NMP24019.1 hypothetical protein [Sulfobacillus harzensis]